MDERIRHYLQQLGNELRRLPESERLDALREIQSHVEDEVNGGTDVDAVLAGLGQPKVLARSYLSAYHLDHLSPGTPPNLPTTISAMAFFASAGLGGIFVVPVLALFLFLFAMMAVLLPIAGVARTFGAHWVTMTGPRGPIPVTWSIPLTLVIGLLSAVVAWGSWLILRLSFNFVSNGYRRWVDRLRATGGEG